MQYGDFFAAKHHKWGLDYGVHVSTKPAYPFHILLGIFVCDRIVLVDMTTSKMII